MSSAEFVNWSQTWPFSLEQLPAETYLVGGSVRDRLLNRTANYLDLDFVLPAAAVETAEAIARHHNAGFVLLDEARQIARVVFASATVDFAQQQGDTLEDDLRRRDFTINAIAYHPHQQQLIDPLQGMADLSAQTLRMVSRENLAADPLRLMRGYRQAAQLGFSIEPDTQAAIAQLAPQLQSVSIERVRSELDALLSASSDIPLAKNNQHLSIADCWHQLWKNQLLQFCLPDFTLQDIDQILAIETAVCQLQSHLPKSAQQYTQLLRGWSKPVPAGCYRSWIKAAKLSRLVSQEVATAQHQLKALTYSRNESQVVLSLLKAQPYIDSLRAGALSRSEQFFLFKSVGASFPAFSVLAIAQGVEVATVVPLVQKFLDPTDAIAHSRPLITGAVLMKQLGISPGPEIGRLIHSVEQAQAAGRITDSESAISYVEQIKDQL